MKKVIGLMTGIFLAGMANAQMDTIPPVPNTLDTSIRKMDSLPHGSKDSSLGKWNGDATAGSQKNNDSIYKDQWNKQGSKVDSTLAGSKPSSDTNYVARKTNVDNEKAEKLTDRVMMRDGQMLIVENGEERKLEAKFIFPSGLVVTADGVVKNKDGTSVKLKDGQYLEIKPVTVKKESEPAKKTPLKKTTVKKNRQ